MTAMAAIDRATGLGAVVVGDLMLDRRLIGMPTGLSAEAPIPTLALRDTVDSPGGAANAAVGLAALGLRVRVLGHLGLDTEAEVLRRASRALGVDLDHATVSEEAPTTLKTRIVSSGQLIARVDREGPAPAVQPAQLEVVLDADEPAVVLFSDYDKGVLTDQTAPSLLALCQSRGVPTVVDPKAGHRARYVGATVLTPNAAELDALAGRALAAGEQVAAARELLAETDAETVMVTLGGDGVLVVSRSDAERLDADCRSVFDVTGAGDTFAATIAAALAGGSDAMTAAQLANTAAGLSVTTPGAAVIGRELLASAVDGPSLEAAVSSVAEAC
jgi:D-beta-D-heptose 7-phosphate kinase/D-beta-D-heptose 1-phosphate adenosyltransferase